MTFEEYWKSLNRHYPFREDYLSDLDVRTAFNSGFIEGQMSVATRVFEVLAKYGITSEIVEEILKEQDEKEV